MTRDEKYKRRALIVRRHRKWVRDHELPPVRRSAERDEATESNGFASDPLDYLPDLG